MGSYIHLFKSVELTIEYCWEEQIYGGLEWQHLIIFAVSFASTNKKNIADSLRDKQRYSYTRNHILWQ